MGYQLLFLILAFMVIFSTSQAEYPLLRLVHTKDENYNKDVDLKIILNIKE